jgi:hypothetical protein
MLSITATMDKTTTMETTNTDMAKTSVSKLSPPLFRFNLDDSIVQLISYFAKKHLLDDRKTYKAEWNIYYEKHYDVFSREIQRLTELGYNNKEPIKDKMFKAGRYYFRKKNLKGAKDREEVEEVEGENNNNHKKIRVDKNILCSFDKHICQMSSTNKIVSPEKSFENYCKNNISEITSEIMNIINTHHLSVSNITAKLKETYRNRYFNIIRKNASS